jgi:hypothetical protein
MALLHLADIGTHFSLRHLNVSLVQAMFEGWLPGITVDWTITSCVDPGTSAAKVLGVVVVVEVVVEVLVVVVVLGN